MNYGGSFSYGLITEKAELILLSTSPLLDLARKQVRDVLKEAYPVLALHSVFCSHTREKASLSLSLADARLLELLAEVIGWSWLSWHCNTDFPVVIQCQHSRISYPGLAKGFVVFQ